MTIVTLVMANGPGFPQGSPDHRYEIGGTLTPGGHLDPEAWDADPEPWRARRIWPGEAPRGGDVQYDPDTGDWSIRLYPGPGAAADAPVHAVLRHAGQLRPGEYLTVCEPDGREYSYRVVGVA